MNFFKRKNKASFVFFIITAYAILGFLLGYLITQFVL
jgi:hypothetical protein